MSLMSRRRCSWRWRRFTGNFDLALERAFIQFAGFTIGRADTIFAFYNGAAYGLVPMQHGRLVGSGRSERLRLHLAVRKRSVGDPVGGRFVRA